MTTHMLQSFSACNSNLSDMMQTQGKVDLSYDLRFALGSTYLCWAFSCASMLRSSCAKLIKQLFEARKITKRRKAYCIEYIRSQNVHKKIRNLIAMILLPKKLHRNDNSQAAYLRAAVSRVSNERKYM